MIRADFSGNGTPHTKAGTLIRFHDEAVHWQRDPSTGAEDSDYSFEAGWSPQGAVCVAHVRWPEFGSLETIVAGDPRLAATPPAACTPENAKARGALILSDSRKHPRLGR
jgi:hypothetical protein